MTTTALINPANCPTLTTTGSFVHGTYDPTDKIFRSTVRSVDLINDERIKKLSAHFYHVEFERLSAHFYLDMSSPFLAVDVVAAWGPRELSEPTTRSHIYSMPGSSHFVLRAGTNHVFPCSFEGPVSKGITTDSVFGARAKLFLFVTPGNTHPYLGTGSLAAQPTLPSSTSLGIAFDTTITFGLPTGQFLHGTTAD
jgi:hypothetical protein